jgi:uridine phosphorylase
MDHLGLDATTAKYAILTGDPARVPAISECLGGGVELTARRGLLCHEVVIQDQIALVVATGIGAPATAIVVEELADLGVHTVVRVGTCGSLQARIRPGHLVVPTGCVREEGTSRQYVTVAFPAVPDLELTSALVAALRYRSVAFHTGIIHCKDAYYLERPDKQLLPEVVDQRWRALRRAGVLATEMESSILFILGALRGLRTATICVNVGKITDPATFSTALDSAVGATRDAFGVLGSPNRDFRLDEPSKQNESYLQREP